MNSRNLVWVPACVLLVSCRGYRRNYPSAARVWGYKPLYGADTFPKKISHSSTPRSVVSPGNMYAFQNYIFQLDPGLGIHVIDNSVPASAPHRLHYLQGLFTDIH